MDLLQLLVLRYEYVNTFDNICTCIGVIVSLSRNHVDSSSSFNTAANYRRTRRCIYILGTLRHCKNVLPPNIKDLPVSNKKLVVDQFSCPSLLLGGKIFGHCTVIISLSLRQKLNAIEIRRKD